MAYLREQEVKLCRIGLDHAALARAQLQARVVVYACRLQQH
jgi:hypothetical protein